MRRFLAGIVERKKQRLIEEGNGKEKTRSRRSLWDWSWERVVGFDGLNRDRDVGCWQSSRHGPRAICSH